jgi:predicted metal-dependent peptidase
MKINIRKPNEKEQQLKRHAFDEAQISRAQLLIKQPFIGMLAMHLDIVTVVDSRLPTASTDGKSIFINADFLFSLDGEERKYLLAHEIWHCVFQHFKRKGNRELQRFNYAADLEIDFLLKKEGFKIIRMLPHEKEWVGCSAEFIYDLLPENYRERFEISDVHEYPGQEGNSNHGDVVRDSDGEEKKTTKTITIIRDDDYNPTISPGIERKWRQWVVSTAQQIERNHGSLPSHIKQIVQARYKPELNWKEILQQFVSHCFGGERQWLPPNRRYIQRGLFLPSRKDSFLSIVVAIDTSGSTTDDLPYFLAELKAIVSTFGRYDITFIECDSKIQNVRNYNEWEHFENEKFEFHGFGGTNFNPVFNYINEKVTEPKLLVFLTDGFGEAPVNPPQYPVLWILTRDGNAPVDWGWKAFLKQNESVGYYA